MPALRLQASFLCIVEYLQLDRVAAMLGFDLIALVGVAKVNSSDTRVIDRRGADLKRWNPGFRCASVAAVFLGP